GQVAVVDLSAGKVTGTRRNTHSANYPLLFDPVSNAVVIVYRLPSRLAVTDADTGAGRQDIGVCGDSDDPFLDASRQRIYVSCGSGDIEVLDASSQGYGKPVRIKSRAGART